MKTRTVALALLGAALAAASSAHAVTARFAYEQAYDNVNDGDWYRLSNDEGTLLTNNQSPVMESLATMFEATGDPLYLERLIWHVDGVLAQRDDVRGIIDYRGIEGACWQDKHYSYGWPYCWVLHSGTIITPMVRAAWLIREHGLEEEIAYDGLTFGEKATAYIAACQETVAHHDEQWREQGHYVFMPDAHFLQWEAGTTNPLNCSNAMGRALLYLHELTGEAEYLDKVERLAHRLHDNMMRLEGGYNAWPYYAEDFLGMGEDIGHASLSVTFAHELYRSGIVFDDDDMAAIGATLTRSITIDDRRVHHNLNGGEVDGAENGRSTLYAWLPLVGWEPAIYTIVRNLNLLENPPDDVSTGGRLQAWAELAHHEPTHCVPAFSDTHWDDPDPHGASDWISAIGAQPRLLMPELREACVTVLEVDSPQPLELWRPVGSDRDLVARWQATGGQIERWLPWIPGASSLDIPATVLEHKPGSTLLQVRQQPALATPAIVEPAPAAGKLGQALTLQLEGSGEAPLWWALAAFPTGARVDPATGLVTWTPGSEGEHAFTVRLDTVAGSVEQAFTWCVGAECGQAGPRMLSCSSSGQRGGLALLALLGLGGAVLHRRRRGLALLLTLGLLGCPGPDKPDSAPPTIPEETEAPEETEPPEETQAPEETAPPVDTGPFDGDGDGWPAATDCDDSDPAIHPGAEDLCDGVDSDCDGVADDACAVQVAAGLVHSCAVMADASLRCWGSDSWGQASPPEGSFAQVAVGTYYSCGVGTDGALSCWGEDSAGQASPPGGAYIHTEASVYGSVGISSAGVISYWGAPLYSLGNPPAGGDFDSSSCGEGHCCGLRTDGSAACWGRGGYSLDTVDVSLRFTALEAGYMHTCGLFTDGTLTCWGWDWYEQTTPAEGSDFVDLSCGHEHCCALRADGSVACWGSGSARQHDAPDEPLVSLSAGAYHSCGLTAEGGVRCWGNNAHGECDGPGS